MTKFIAHRGLSSIYYQNSEAAFLAAGKSDFFFGMETDVWLTADGKWVCCHDSHPFADLSISIKKVTLEEAQKLPMDPMRKRGVDMQEDSYICTLERYLEINKEYNKVPVIELKNIPNDEELKGLIEIVRDMVGLDKAIFISFHFTNIERILKFAPEVTGQVLCSYPIQARHYAKKGYDVDQMFLYAYPWVKNYVHKKGREINVWTVNSKFMANQFEKHEFDYVTTDCDFSNND